MARIVKGDLNRGMGYSNYYFEYIGRTQREEAYKIQGKLNLLRIRQDKDRNGTRVLKEYLILHPAVDPRTIPSKFELYISLRLGENFRFDFFPREHGRRCWKKYFLKVDSIFRGERRERKEERAGCYTEGAKLFIFFSLLAFVKFVLWKNLRISRETML